MSVPELASHHSPKNTQHLILQMLPSQAATPNSIPSRHHTDHPHLYTITFTAFKNFQSPVSPATVPLTCWRCNLKWRTKKQAMEWNADFESFVLSGGGFSDDSLKQFSAELKWKCVSLRVSHLKWHEGQMENATFLEIRALCQSYREKKETQL